MYKFQLQVPYLPTYQVFGGFMNIVFAYIWHSALWIYFLCSHVYWDALQKIYCPLQIAELDPIFLARAGAPKGQFRHKL